MVKEINLQMFKRSESKVYTGRPEGEKARSQLKLDDFDKTDDIMKITIPEDTFSVNSSFFSGMFQKSLKTLGEEAFRRKYLFECKKKIIINVNLEKDIRICLIMLAANEKEV